MRAKAGFTPTNIGAPMDVLWFRLSRRAGDPSEPFGRADRGQMLVLINRGAHWQCGYLVLKGGFDLLKRQDVTVLREMAAGLKQ